MSHIVVTDKSAANYRAIAAQRARDLAEFRATLDANSDSLNRAFSFCRAHAVEMIFGALLGLGLAFLL